VAACHRLVRCECAPATDTVGRPGLPPIRSLSTDPRLRSRTSDPARAASGPADRDMPTAPSDAAEGRLRDLRRLIKRTSENWRRWVGFGRVAPRPRRADRYSSVWAIPSGSVRRGARIHTSCAVVTAPTLERAFARWCFTVGARSRSSGLRGFDGAGVPGVATGRGAREPAWIGPARRHAPKGAGGGRRALLGRLGHESRGGLTRQGPPAERTVLGCEGRRP